MKKALLSMAVLAMVAGTSFGALANEVRLDVSGAMNFDAIGTQAEVDQANTHTGVNHRLTDIFAQAGSPTSYQGTDHNFANQYTALAYWQNVSTGEGVGSTVTTPYGTYDLAAGATAANISNEIGTANAARLGTQRGKTDAYAEGVTTLSIDFSAGQQGQYNTINLLFSGEQTAADISGYARKSAWVKVTARYADSSSELVWTSPRADVFEGGNAYGDDRDNIAGGLPSPVGYVSGGSALEQAYKDTFNQVAVTTMYLANGGGDPDRYSYGRAVSGGGSWYMYDIAGGIAVDPTKTLVGLDVTVDNGPNLWVTGYPEGEEVNIYGVTGDLVPEPATMSLLAIGGIGMLLRKKRR